MSDNIYDIRGPKMSFSSKLVDRPQGQPTTPSVQQQDPSGVPPPAMPNERSTYRSTMDTRKRQESEKVKRVGTYGMDEHIDILKRMANDPAISGKQANLQEMKAKLAAMEQKDAPVNLGGLAGFMDLVTGDRFNLQKRFGGGPDPRREFSALKSKLESRIDKGQTELGKMRSDFIKSQLLNIHTGGFVDTASRTETVGERVGPALTKKDVLKNKKDLASDQTYKDAQGLIQVKADFDAFKRAIEKYGGVAATGAGSAEQKAAYRELVVAYNAYKAKLGALSGDDKAILEGIVTFPTTGPMDWAEYYRTGGDRGLMAQIKSADQKINKQFMRAYEVMDQRWHPESGVREDIDLLIRQFRDPAGAARKYKYGPKTKSSTQTSPQGGSRGKFDSRLKKLKAGGGK